MNKQDALRRLWRTLTSNEQQDTPTSRAKAQAYKSAMWLIEKIDTIELETETLTKEDVLMELRKQEELPTTNSYEHGYKDALWFSAGLVERVEVPSPKQAKPEPRYYILLPQCGYLMEPDNANKNWYPRTNKRSKAKKFTKEEIDKLDENYWAFAIEVGDPK